MNKEWERTISIRVIINSSPFTKKDGNTHEGVVRDGGLAAAAAIAGATITSPVLSGAVRRQESLRRVRRLRRWQGD